MFALMRLGAVVEIKPYQEGTEDYVASRFWMSQGYIWSTNPVIGTMRRDELNEATLTEHLERMVQEGFQIVLHT